MTTEIADQAIHKTLHVAVSPERAFDVFTNGWADWWPVATHSIGAGEASVDWRVGGLGIELVDGVRHEWLDVVEFDPPHTIGMRWRVNPESPTTDLRVTFAADGDGTRVELTHSGWRAYSDAGVSLGSYDGGWDTVLDHYTRAIAAL